MRCVICGRLPTEDHNRKTHFVHDNMELLDGTVASNNRLRFYPAPWQISQRVKTQLIEEWSTYSVR